MIGQIHARQLFHMVFFIIFPTALLFLPTFSVGAALQGVWICILLAGGSGLFFSYLLLSIYKKYPNKNLIQILEHIFGKYIGKTIGMFLTFSLFYIAVFVVREYTVFMQTTILNKTPSGVIIGMIIFLCACAVRSGIVVISRLADLIIPIFLISLIAILLLLLPSMKPYNLTPIFIKGSWGIFKGTLPPLVWFSEIFIISFFLPLVKEKEQLHKSIYGSVLLSCILLIVTTIVIITVFGVYMAARTKFSLFETVSLTHAYFIEQFDIILVSIWLMGLFMKLSIIYFAIVYSLGQVINVKSCKSFVLPMGLLLGIATVSFYPTAIQFIEHLSGGGTLFISIFTIVFPFILFVITRFERRNLT